MSVNNAYDEILSWTISAYGMFALFASGDVTPEDMKMFSEKINDFAPASLKITGTLNLITKVDQIDAMNPKEKK